MNRLMKRQGTWFMNIAVISLSIESEMLSLPDRPSASSLSCDLGEGEGWGEGEGEGEGSPERPSAS